MSQKYEKLKTLLKELFQLDQPDLDFGLYRIMHAKSAEISQFLDNDLLPQVKAVFKQHKYADKADLEKNLSELIAGVEAAGMNPDDSPKITDIKIRLETAVDFALLESEVYDHLYRFFKRYYFEGDFLARRIYKPGVYAIPYEGEEIAFHWANKDQYYIKTCEYLRDYVFRLRPEDEMNPMRVHFRLVDGTEGEHSNVKTANGKDRVFILAEPGESGHDFIAEENDGVENPELVIRFNYRPATLSDWPTEERRGKRKPPTQKNLIDLAVKQILDVTNLSSWITELGKPHVMASGEQADYRRLEAHLRRYTARNTFDFFIHKDLDTFLRRELDFYIKNEVMYLDDVENESILRVERYLSKIKVLRMIAGKIIDFLVQIEEFQKKLWLKKKFVIETHYCITLGCIPEEFYLEIAANEAQREEWVTLYSIDQINGDLVTPGYSSKLSPEFLNAYPTLVVDTRFFDKDFESRMLEAIGDVDEITDGVLFHSENCDAMRLATRRLAASIECAYIDPPYNTGNDGFIYRDSYRHSSWLTFINDRLQVLLPLARNDSALFVSIDDNEVGNLINLVKGHSSSAELVTLVAAQLNPRGRTLDKYLAKTHEYVGAFALFGTHDAIREVPKGKAAQAAYRERDRQGRFRLLELRNRNPVFTRANRPNLFFPLFAGPKGGSVTLAPDHTHTVEILPQNSAGEDGCWTWSKDKVHAQRDELVARRVRTGAWRVFRKDRLHGEDGLVTTTKVKSIWKDREINNENGKELVGHLFGKAVFDFPKPVALIERCIEIGMATGGGIFIDFFAGSGTSGHAIINLNRQDSSRRKFVLVEMGNHFNTVLLPRLKKVTFTPDWKDGKPVRLAKPEEAERSPRIVKVMRLESYEDVLNNLVLQRSKTQQSVLDTPEAQGKDGFREQYILRYMLNVETRGSQSLLNTQAFTDPTSYQLKVKQPGSDESREVNVDLIETFNWLAGLRVKQISAPQSFIASFNRDTEKRLCLESRLKQDANGPYWFRTLTGTTPDGRKALVIWRKLTGDPEKDNLVLDEWFTSGHLDADCEFDIVWVNGGNNLENIKPPGNLWKVRLIEEDFHRLMFDTEGQ